MALALVHTSSYSSALYLICSSDIGCSGMGPSSASGRPCAPTSQQALDKLIANGGQYAVGLAREYVVIGRHPQVAPRVVHPASDGREPALVIGHSGKPAQLVTMQVHRQSRQVHLGHH